MGVWYCTREDVARAADIKVSAYMNADIDSAIESASRAIDGGNQIGGLLRRRFYPEIATRYFDWPDRQGSRTWRLWLNQHELISVTSITTDNGDTTLSASQYILRPDYGPPFARVEIDLSSTGSWSAGDTHQKAIAITGTFGYSNDSEPAGTVSEDLDSSETGVDVSNSYLIGVGSIIKIDDERMIVTDKAWLDTGLTISGALDADDSVVSITLSDTTNAPVAGEKIMIDSEIMDVLAVAGTAVTARRATDGSVLASHSSGASILCPRTLTVSRGALGTSGAAHTSSTAITRHAVPGLVRELCIAYALNNIEQRNAAYARESGSGENAREFTGRGIRSLERDCKRAYGRQLLMGAV